MEREPTELSFWRTFISDLFLGTVKRLLLFPFLGVLIGLFAFYVLNFPLIDKTGLFLPIKWIILVLSFFWFLLLGFVNGLVFSVLYTTGKKFDELHDGVQGLLDLLMGKVLSYIPKTESAITTQELEKHINAAIKNVTRNSKREFSFFSLVGIPARLMLRVILKCIKFVIKRQTLDKLEERGETTISAQTIEAQARRELTGLVVNRARDIISFYTYLLYGEFILVFGLPFGLYFLF